MLQHKFVVQITKIFVAFLSKERDNPAVLDFLNIVQKILVLRQFPVLTTEIRKSIMRVPFTAEYVLVQELSIIILTKQIFR